MTKEFSTSAKDLNWQLLTKEDKTFVRSLVAAHLAKQLTEGVNPLDDFGARAGHNLKPLDSNYDYHALSGQSFGVAGPLQIKKPRHRYYKTTEVPLPTDVSNLKRTIKKMLGSGDLEEKNKTSIKKAIAAHLTERLEIGLNPVDDFESRSGHTINYTDFNQEYGQVKEKSFGSLFQYQELRYLRWQALEPTYTKNAQKIWQKVELIVKGLAALRISTLFGLSYLKTNPVDVLHQFHFASYVPEFMAYIADEPDCKDVLHYFLNEQNRVKDRKANLITQAQLFFEKRNGMKVRRSGFGHTVIVDGSLDTFYDLTIWQYPLQVVGDHKEYSADEEEYSPDFKKCKIWFKLFFLDLNTKPNMLVLVDELETGISSLRPVDTEETLLLAEWILGLAVVTHNAATLNGATVVDQYLPSSASQS